jgi:hypothetical protein
MENKDGSKSFGYLSDPSQKVPWDEAIKLHPSRKTNSYSIDIPSTKAKFQIHKTFQPLAKILALGVGVRNKRVNLLCYRTCKLKCGCHLIYSIVDVT